MLLSSHPSRPYIPSTVSASARSRMPLRRHQTATSAPSVRGCVTMRGMRKCGAASYGHAACGPSTLASRGFFRSPCRHAPGTSLGGRGMVYAIFGCDHRPVGAYYGCPQGGMAVMCLGRHLLACASCSERDRSRPTRAMQQGLLESVPVMPVLLSSGRSGLNSTKCMARSRSPEAIRRLAIEV